MFQQKRKGTWVPIVGIIALLLLLIINGVKLIPLVQQSSLGESVEPVKINFPSWYDTLTSIMGVGSVLVLVVVFLILYYGSKQRQQGGF